MRGAVRNRQRREKQQRHDLDSVDRDIDHRGSVDALERDPGHRVGEDNRDQRHENRAGNSCVHRSRRDRADDVSDHDAHRGDHDARIHPVVEMRRPADYELRHARELVCLGPAQERLLREQVRTARTRIKFRQLRVRQRGRIRQHQRHENSGPHRHPRRKRVTRLLDERNPQECSRGDERHRVDRDAGQAEGRHHLFLFFSHLASFDSRRRWLSTVRTRWLPLRAGAYGGLKQEKCHFKIE